MFYVINDDNGPSGLNWLKLFESGSSTSLLPAEEEEAAVAFEDGFG